MKMMRVIGAAAVAMMLTTSAARAQEAGQLGIVMSYPAAVAVVWHVTDTIAVRPEFSFSGSHNDSDITTVDGTTLGVGVSGLLYVGKWEALRTYVSPRYTYNRSSSTIKTTFPFDPTLLAQLPTIGLTIPSTEQKTTASTMSLGGSFGAQYALHKRFSAFGEVGFEYGWSSSASSTSSLSPILGTTIQPSFKRWGTRSAAGVIFYF